MKNNRVIFGLFICVLVCACAIMSLPLYSFNASVYTKKSSNTFVGDEKYVEARAEVEEEAENYRSQGNRRQVFSGSRMLKIANMAGIS